jgi:hypothetical protein
MIRVRSIAMLLAIVVVAIASYAQQPQIPQPIERSPAAMAQQQNQNNAAVLQAQAMSLPEAPSAMLDAANPFVKPSTPLAEAPREHKFFDRQQWLALDVHAAVRLADTIKTCRELAHGGVEDWIPTQSCAGVAAWDAGSVGVALGVGWLAHRHGWHRLERIVPWIGTGAAATGLTKSVFNIR